MEEEDWKQRADYELRGNKKPPPDPPLLSLSAEVAGAGLSGP